MPGDRTLDIGTVLVARPCLAAIQSYLREHGLLLGPDGLTRATVAHRWHHVYDLDGSVRCNHPDTDWCADSENGEWSDWLYTLTLIPEEGT